MVEEWFKRLVYFPAKIILLISVFAAVALWATGYVELNLLIAVVGLALGAADYINGLSR
jgi:hypothetical protein